MAVDLSSLSTISSTAGALSGLIVVNPQNVGYTAQQPAGSTGAFQTETFFFNYEGENTVTLKSDITDHYIENNSAIEDQISLKPELITVRGFIGELNDVAPLGLTALKTIASKLTVISGYAPVISSTALIAYNDAVLAFETLRTAASAGVSAWNFITGSPTLNKQQQAFMMFYGYWQLRTLFTIQTPWRVFKDVAIETLRAVQDEETDTITDFEITFKQLRFATTTNVGNIDLSFDGRSAFQAASLTDQGTSRPPAFGTPFTSQFGSLLAGAN